MDVMRLFVFLGASCLSFQRNLARGCIEVLSNATREQAHGDRCVKKGRVKSAPIKRRSSSRPYNQKAKIIITLARPAAIPVTSLVPDTAFFVEDAEAAVPVALPVAVGEEE